MNRTIVLAGVAVGALGVYCAQDPSDLETIGPKELTLGGDPVHVVLPPDAIASIDEPDLISATEAKRLYDDDEPVLGVVVGDEARAYSLWHLDRHEIVNDHVGGRAIAATW